MSSNLALSMKTGCVTFSQSLSLKPPHLWENRKTKEYQYASVTYKSNKDGIKIK